VSSDRRPGSDTWKTRGGTGADPWANEPTGRRDAIVVAAVCVVVFSVGALTKSFDRLEPLIAWADVGDELIAAFLVAATGIAVLAVRGARREAREAALREETDEQIRALIAESPVVSFTWLPQEHRYRYVSPQIETLFGVSAGAHSQDWSAQIHPEDRARVAELSRIADRDGTTYLAEYRIVRPDGEVRWIHDESVYYDLDDEGRPQLAQGVMFDITERKGGGGSCRRRRGAVPDPRRAGASDLLRVGLVVRARQRARSLHQPADRTASRRVRGVLARGPDGVVRTRAPRRRGVGDRRVERGDGGRRAVLGRVPATHHER
jgi:PAS domain S-box-containing protein